jgi:class 3 adenylate cyclase
LNILPEEVAEELKEKGHTEAQLIEKVTVLFTDFKGFTDLAEKLSAKELVNDLNICFSEFDRIMQKYQIEKIKTIGDSYMAASGLPIPKDKHTTMMLHAALDIRDFIEDAKAKRIEEGLPFFELRIGLNTGPVVAGIVGVKKFQYDIWGDTVNTASKMESSGEVGKVNISQATYDLLKDDAEFEFEYRGKIKAKGKGEMNMYFVERKVKAGTS